MIALVGAIAVSCALSTLLNISMLWTLSGEGATTFAVTLVLLFSGMVIPLPLFPDWTQPIFRALPFAGLVDFPFRLYPGNLAPSSLRWVMLQQWLWVTLLVLGGRWLLSRATLRMVVQGG